MTEISIPALASLIRTKKRAVVFAHFNPDADAYGSSCGLAFGLRSIGLEATVYNESGLVPRYTAIPGTGDVLSALPANLPSEDDLVLVCDCGSLERAGEAFALWIRSCPLVINIDHHISNSKFGHQNLVVESASSTSEIVFDLLVELERLEGRDDVIGTESASCLMAGIIGDTGSFRYPSTSAHTFDVAAALYRRGARPDALTQRLFSTVSIAAVRLQAEAMLNVNLESHGRFAEIVVTKEMLARIGADILDADSLAERGRDLEGVEVAALFKQDGDIWRVSLRSRGLVNVSEIAQSFGGGGHKPAAAFRWRKDFETLRSELRARIAAALDQSHA